MANPYFNAVYYLQQNPDVFSAGYTVATAWDHYVKHGANEANVTGGTFRAPNPWFDVKYYLANNPDLVRAGITPATALDHFLTYGSTAGEDRAPNATIAAAPITEAKLLAYAKANADLQTAFGISATATTLTAAQQTSLLNHFYAYGYNETRADKPAAVTIPDVDAGKTFTLTTGADALTGTSGNDTFNGVMQFTGAGNADNGTFNSADNLNGGAGTDVLNVRVTALGADGAVAPVLTGIEKVSVSNIATVNNAIVNLASASGVETVEFKDTVVGSSTRVINGPTTAKISLDNADSTTHNVNLGADTGRTGTTDAVAVTIANGSGATGAAAGLQLVTNNGTTADTSFEVLNITNAGAANFVQVGNSLAGVTSITVGGSSTATSGYGLTLTEAANFNSVKTINASSLTGAGLNISTTLAADVTFTGSAQADRVALTGGVTNLTSADKLTFAGGKDTLAFGTDTAIASYSAAQLALINAITDVEVLEFTAATATAGSTLKANDFTVAQEFVLSGGANASAAAAAGWTITGAESADAFKVTTTNISLVANTAAANSGANGFDALVFTGAAVGQTANLELSGRTVQGQAGQAGTTAAGGNGGNAIDFGGNITKLVITSSGTAANTLQGGAGGNGAGTKGTGAAAIENGTAVQAVEIKGAQALTIAGGAAGGGTGTGGAAAGGFSNAVNVDASTMTGKLTVTLSTGNDIISVGTGGSVVRGFGGKDALKLNTGTDQVDLRVAADSLANADNIMTIENFAAGTDKLVIGGQLVGTIKSGALYTATGTGTIATDLGSAITAGGGFGGSGNAAIVTVTGTGAGTYLVVDTSNNGAYDNASDVVVKLVGLTGTLSTGDFALAIA